MSDKPGSACRVRQMKSRLLQLSPGSRHDADRSHGRREDRENTVELLAGASAELVAMRTIFRSGSDGFAREHNARPIIRRRRNDGGEPFRSADGTLRNPLLARVLTLRVYVFLGAMLFAAGLFVTMHVFGVR